MRDLREEQISEWTARNVYHVVFDDTFTVDLDATARQREAVRVSRIARGKNWDDFQAEWIQLRPSDAALAYFGSWPDGIREQPLVRI